MHTIRLLGGASVCAGSGSTTSRPIPRVRMAVLAVLALSKTRSVSRDRVMALVWPDSDGPRARHQLREVLYRLRETLGDSAVTSSGDDIQLAPFVSCDALEFETAIARKDWGDADRLYAGPLLDGFFFSGSTEFERWLDAERVRFSAMHRAALEAEILECVSRGDSIRALALSRKWSEADPYSAKACLALMQSLVGTGDRVGALRHAAAYETLLTNDLDAEPDEAIVALVRQLRRAASTSVAESAQANGTSTGDHQEPDHFASVSTPPSTSRPVGRRTRVSISLGIAALLLIAAFIRTQWLDARDAADASRLVVAPFRVSGSDSSLAFLRDGLVELLSTQFTGDFGPEAIDAGEILRLAARDRWTETTTAADARRLATSLRAGQVLYGSIVGTAKELTISASLLETSSGIVRAGPVLASGPLDSLASIVSQLTARLLARRAGAEDVDQTSAGALRAFVRGMSEYRRANWIAAGTELFRAFELDSSFTPAAFRFALIHAITAPTTPLGDRPTRDPRFTRLYGLLWQQRARLRLEDRRLVEAIADSLYVRWPMQSLPRLERVVELLPNSVEAWDILGDDYYHAGALVGRDNWRARAKSAFTRAMALDSAVAVNARTHLPDIAFIEHDAAAFEVASKNERGSAHRRYQSALLSGNASSVRAAREEYAKAWSRGTEDGLDWAFQGVSVPQSEADSLLIQFERAAATAEQKGSVVEWAIDAAEFGGRPTRAMALRERAYGVDTTAIDASILLYGAATREVENRLLRRALAAREKQLHPDECIVALARLRRGDSVGAAAILATEPAMDDALPAADVVLTVRRGLVAQAAICGQVLRGVLASLSAGDDRWLLRADSIMRHLQINYGAYWNDDVAHALARRGRYAEAAAAARRRFIDRGPVPRLVMSLRDEGRWAALAGDTLHAVAAYRHYLLWRENPEAALIPQRDSVRRELNRLLAKR